MEQALKVFGGEVKDIGDFEVRRLLPSAGQRSIGPFVFWDHFGPVQLPAGRNMDVRPHPHIGLATVTWLYEGQITHRDSLGKVQDITPGAVNWMTAGSGIVHSERTPDSRRDKSNALHGLQIWLALPQEHEHTEPAFHHFPADSLPTVTVDEVRFDLIAGSACQVRSPVPVFSPLCYLSARLQAGQSFNWIPQHEEEALYIVQGSVIINGHKVEQHQMAVLDPSQANKVTAEAPALIALFGGQPLGPRYVWWNFVASDRDLIKRAAKQWKNGGFDRVPGDAEFIPLPEDRPMP